VRRNYISSVLARAFVAGTLVCACIVPVQAGLFDDEVARKQLSEQSKRVDELKNQSEAFAGRLGKIEESLRHQPTLQLLDQIELLKREIQTLRGQLEVVTNSVENNSKRQRDMYVDLDTRMRRLEQQGAPTAPVAPAAGVDAPPPGASSAGTTGADETRDYEAAQNLRRIGNYKRAIAAFQGFLTQHPKSSLAHRAQYWIGDSYFNLRDYKNAIVSQRRLLETFPDSASAPDAMLNIASSQVELGATAAARKSMDTLVARYPRSEAAEKARRRMTTLR
jgi:tol-pal system protein YbgF